MQPHSAHSICTPSWLARERLSGDSPRPADADLDAGRVVRQWLADWRRQAGCGDQAVVADFDVGPLQLPRCVFGVGVAERAVVGVAEQAPPSGQKVLQFAQLISRDRGTRPDDDGAAGVGVGGAWPSSAAAVHQPPSDASSEKNHTPARP
jgi:hypothetical protein